MSGDYIGSRSVQVFRDLDAARMAIPASNAMSIEVWLDGETVEFVRDPSGTDLVMYDGSRWRIEDGSASGPPALPFGSRDEFLVAHVPETAPRAGFIEDGRTCWIVRDPAGPIMADSGRWAPDGPATPAHFGAQCDGVWDDTLAIRALHAWSNSRAVAPDYRGVARFAVQASALIPISTDVDFCGAEIVLLGGLVETPSFEAIQTAFVVVDPGTPLETGTVPAVPGDLGLGSLSPTAAFWPHEGHVYFQGDAAGPQIASRDGTTSFAYRQAFHVVKDARAIYPLEADLSACDSVYYRARRNPADWLEIRNLNIDAALFNNARVFHVTRNMVRIEAVRVWQSAPLSPSISQIVAIEECGGIILRDIVSVAQASFENQGTYVVHVNRASEVSMEQCTALNGWGWQAAADVSGLYLINSEVNRFDCHNGGFNLIARGCTFHEAGVRIGWGGGLLTVDDCTAINCALINSRPDYGGYWFGAVTVSNCRLHQRASVTATAIDFATSPVGVAVLPMPLPRAIVIDGLTRVDPPGAGNRYIVPLRIVVAAAAQAMVAPSSISIRNVSGTGSWAFHNLIDFLNMTAPARVSLSISGIAATRALTGADIAALRSAVGMPAKTKAVVSADLDLTISDVNHLGLDLSGHDGAPRAELSACRKIVRASGVPGCRMIIAGCSFDAPALMGAEVAGPVGASKGPGTYSITSVTGCTFQGAWDLSQVATMAALLWAGSNDAAMVLPAGATQATAMSGWRMSF